MVVKRMLEYLKDKYDMSLVYKIVYKGNTGCTLVGYSYSYYASDMDVRQFISGYDFNIGNSLVSSRKAISQHTVALSTIEAQYMVLAKE